MSLAWKSDPRPPRPKKAKKRFVVGHAEQLEYSSQSRKKAIFGISMKNSTQYKVKLKEIDAP